MKSTYSFELISFGRQMATFADNSVANFFFSLTMATKMVAAWSAVDSCLVMKTGLTLLVFNFGFLTIFFSVKH